MCRVFGEQDISRTVENHKPSLAIVTEAGMGNVAKDPEFSVSLLLIEECCAFLDHTDAGSWWS